MSDVLFSILVASLFGIFMYMHMHMLLQARCAGFVLRRVIESCSHSTMATMVEVLKNDVTHHVSDLVT